MSNDFNVNEYWIRRGRTYIHEQRTPAEYHRLQEHCLLDILRKSGVPMGRVLELGCGFGRVTKLLAETFPKAEINAVDLSLDQLDNARRYCSGCENIQFAPHDFYSGQDFPHRDYDTAIAIEVFLHHLAPVVFELFRKLSRTARYVVNIDWSEAWIWPLPDHVWVHDYEALYEAAGLRSAVFPMPEKLDGKQQKLFIAARDLGSTLPRLEREWQATVAPEAAVLPRPDSYANWSQRLQLAADDIAQKIPAGEMMILINDDQWGKTAPLDQHCIVPFLEKDGRYWGPPPDDATAWRELERLRRLGARYLAVAWNSFWWLDHFARFHRRLRADFPSVLANERMMIFKLRP